MSNLNISQSPRTSNLELKDQGICLILTQSSSGVFYFPKKCRFGLGSPNSKILINQFLFKAVYSKA